MALTDKQVRFIDEYMIDMNATAAYGRAGYTAEGNSAEASASRLLRNAKIQQELNKRQKKMQEESGISVQWVLKEFVENHKMAREVGELAASNKALESIGKHLGMFKDKVEITGTLSVEKLLEQL